MLVAIEVGGSKLQAALGDREGRIVETRRAVADAERGAAAIRAQVLALVRPWMEGGDVAAIGIGFGGPVDEATGRVTRSHQVSGWLDFDLVGWGRESFGVPCVVANDSDLAAWAEARLGAGRGCARVFYTNIGSGMGGGLIVNGERYVAPGGSMEFGQTWAYSELERRWDRLEKLCSGWAIERRAAALIQQFGVGVTGGAITVLQAWQRGDELAVQLMNDWFQVFGRAIANAIALFNPDAVVIGGGVAEFGEPILEAIRSSVAPLVFKPFASKYRIARAALGEMCVPVGALMLAGSVRERSDDSAPSATSVTPP
jgi:glucokinase